MNAKVLGYWISTALIAFIFVSSGVFYVMACRRWWRA
ncbi:MAG: hypothetical protein JWP08_1608 [Bryobacterales bacterium]|nr:hypothetical protein [Bryobacterales bacterium]